MLTFAKRTLKEGSSYTAEYGETKNNKIEVKITGQGDFTGTVIKKVKIS